MTREISPLDNPSCIRDTEVLMLPTDRSLFIAREISSLVSPFFIKLSEVLISETEGWEIWASYTWASALGADLEGGGTASFFCSALTAGFLASLAASFFDS